jgi:flavin-dependent thymidylate synthase
MQPRHETLLTITGQTPLNLPQKIELAGRTCYKSFDKITADSAVSFIKGILKRGHESVIEHSWFTFSIPTATEAEILQLVLGSPLLAQNISRQDNGSWLLSGNARMFRDLFRQPALTPLALACYKNLSEHFPILFADLSIDQAPAEPPIVTFNQPLALTAAEQGKHGWAMVRFYGGSRAFTHQLVRHRLMAISQESQRYCDEKGFFDHEYYVLPPTIEKNDLSEYYQNKLQQIDQWYQELQIKLKTALQASGQPGQVNEDARFLLPNAVASEIVISAPLNQWRQIFKMRCEAHAQWEIRSFMLQVLAEFQTRWPEVFADFTIDPERQQATLLKK